MKFIWRADKNKKLQTERGVSFEQVLEIIAQNKIDQIVDNPSLRYAGQKVYILKLNGYPHFVPFIDLSIETRELITIVPSRKLKIKIRRNNNEKT